MKNLFNILLFSIMLTLLTAAAVPNFLEAQYRQRMARVKADLPALAAGLEAYKIDFDKYPGDGTQYCWNYPAWPCNQYWYIPDSVTTPVPYLSSTREDPFREDVGMSVSFRRYRYWYVDMTWGTAGTRSSESAYYAFLKSWYGSWRLGSSGPDGLFGPYYSTGSYPGTSYPQLPLPYDPTNGIISNGDIEHAQKVLPYLQAN
jgi:type II secretory pathway pseudopilin PulG